MRHTSGDVGSLVGLLDETDSEFKPNLLLKGDKIKLIQALQNTL